MIVNKIIGSLTKSQIKNIEPTTSKQEISPDNGYDNFSKVIVNPVTNLIDNNIKEEYIREGFSILGVEGKLNPYTSDTYIKNVEISEITNCEIYDMTYDNRKLKINLKMTKGGSLKLLLTFLNTKGRDVRLTDYDFECENTFVSYSELNTKIEKYGEGQIILTLRPKSESIEEYQEDVIITVTVKELENLVHQTKTARACGTYTYDSGYNGLSSVIVKFTEEKLTVKYIPRFICSDILKLPQITSENIAVNATLS